MERKPIYTISEGAQKRLKLDEADKVDVATAAWIEENKDSLKQQYYAYCYNQEIGQAATRGIVPALPDSNYQASHLLDYHDERKPIAQEAMRDAKKYMERYPMIANGIPYSVNEDHVRAYVRFCDQQERMGQIAYCFEDEA